MMKKNRMMRLASGLLVAVLITTSMISGTYAKYVTTANASDTARVAKWGVEVAATTDLFDEDYDIDDTNKTFKFAGEYSVSAASAAIDDRDNLVAPGTKGSMTFSITGVPEVAVNVNVSFNATENALKMVTLPIGEYTDYTKATYAEEDKDETDYDDTTVAAYNEKIELEADYYPVLWTLKKSATKIDAPEDWASVGAVVGMEGVELQVIEDYFAAEGMSKNYEPNTNLTKQFGYYELSWEWPYEAKDNKELYDAADTYIGNVAAGIVTDANVKLEEAFDFTITVTQID